MTQAIKAASLVVSREGALALLAEYTKSDSLIKHALAVDAGVRFYARKFGEDETLWGVTALLHDFDYEMYPNPDEGGHPYKGCEILTSLGYPEILINAILGHADYSGVPRESLLAKTLYACDELAGLITASVYVRPDRSIHTLEVSSVKKKMKDKHFAKGVNRDDVIRGAEDMNIPLDEHISNMIVAMRAEAVTLGLNGVS